MSVTPSLPPRVEPTLILAFTSIIVITLTVAGATTAQMAEVLTAIVGMVAAGEIKRSHKDT